MFHCFDTGKVEKKRKEKKERKTSKKQETIQAIALSHVNDDYCDCEDGR